MYDFKHDILLRLVKLLNVILAFIPFFVSWRLYYLDQVYAMPFFWKGNVVISLLFMILYSLFGRVYDAFKVSLNTISEMVYSEALAAFVTDFIMYIVLLLIIRGFPNVLLMIAVFLCQIVLFMIWSKLANGWYFKTFPPKNTAVIYDERKGMEDLVEEYGMTKKFAINHILHVSECLDSGLKNLDEYRPEAVFLCGVHSHDRNIILKYCVKNNITVYVIPRIGDTLMSSARRIHMLHLPVLRVDRYTPDVEYAVIKRTFDILLSLAAVIILFPILLITALSIKIEDGGPVLYRQIRLTKDGKQFYLMKFRSMRIDAEKDGIARLSTGASDDRITRTGRVIRRYRIDELPQLFNILLGQMSIVGPRPERPSIAKQYEKELPEFALRLQVKAGLTGYAQVYGKYNTMPYDKLMMDLMYIAHASILEDIRIIFATIKILFIPESTEGIAEGEITAQRKNDAA